jgi:hypothetical protein
MKNVSMRNTAGVSTAKLPPGTPTALFFALLPQFSLLLHPYLPFGESGAVKRANAKAR